MQVEVRKIIEDTLLFLNLRLHINYADIKTQPIVLQARLCSFKNLCLSLL